MSLEKNGNPRKSLICTGSLSQRRWWESNPRALADLSHFECDLLRPLEYISVSYGQQLYSIRNGAFTQAPIYSFRASAANTQFLSSQVCTFTAPQRPGRLPSAAAGRPEPRRGGRPGSGAGTISPGRRTARRRKGRGRSFPGGKEASSSAGADRAVQSSQER